MSLFDIMPGGDKDLVGTTTAHALADGGMEKLKYSISPETFDVIDSLVWKGKPTAFGRKVCKSYIPTNHSTYFQFIIQFHCLCLSQLAS